MYIRFLRRYVVCNIYSGQLLVDPAAISCEIQKTWSSGPATFERGETQRADTIVQQATSEPSPCHAAAVVTRQATNASWPLLT